MKILVTGGAGFIGSNFIHYWLKNYADDKLINLDLLSYAGNLENLKDIEDHPNYRFVKGNISDEALLNDLVPGLDLIINFAAETHVDRSIKASSDFIETNVLGTQRLLEAARKAGNIRFHQVSTDEVYGSLEIDSELRFHEELAFQPSSPYSASKAAADHLVRAYYSTHKLPITISHCSNNYGPYQYPEKLIPLFLSNLIDGEKLPVYGTGKNVRDWLHVNDHVRALDKIIRQGSIGETYCIGGDNELSNLEISKKLLSFFDLGLDMIEYVDDRLGHDLRYGIDSSKIKRELAWEAEVDFETGLKETIEWYRDNEAWWRPLKEKLIFNKK